MIPLVMRVLRMLTALLVALAGCSAAGTRPASPTAWRDVAAAREAVRCGRPDEGVARLRRALARHPGDREVRRELGLLLDALGDPAAETVLTPLASRETIDAEVDLALARAALRRADADAATAHLARLAASPGDVGVDAYLVRAEIALLRGDRAAARQALLHALVLDPGHPRARAGLDELDPER
jgi:Flp pilus assembly protein TadD